MSRLLDRLAKTWGSIARDVVLIVVSILIAFALDAWWAGLKEERAQAEQILTLRSEFVAARRSLTTISEWLKDSSTATDSLLLMMGPQSPSADPARCFEMLKRSLNFGFTAPDQTALRSVLATGNAKVAENDSLAAMLGRWPDLLEDLAGDSEHLERNRDEDLQDALIDVGIPGIAVAAVGPELGLPASKFPTDTRRMLGSVRVYAALSYRALRFRILQMSVAEGLARADAIIRELDRMSADEGD